MYFREENNKWEIRYDKDKILNTKLNSIATLLIVATVSISVKSSVTGNDFMAIPLSTGINLGHQFLEGCYMK